MGGLTQITIDFQRSHLVFPILIGSILALLGLAIVITRRHEILAAPGYWADILRDMDKRRFLGVLALTVVYFTAMVPVGDLWPNTGRGFLLCSVPFLFLAGLLFLHQRRPASLAILAAVSLIAPTLTWWVFGEVFFLTLP